jgi:hypothetical protein
LADAHQEGWSVDRESERANLERSGVRFRHHDIVAGVPLGASRRHTGTWLAAIVQPEVADAR